MPTLRLARYFSIGLSGGGGPINAYFIIPFNVFYLNFFSFLLLLVLMIFIFYRVESLIIVYASGGWGLVVPCTD